MLIRLSILVLTTILWVSCGQSAHEEQIAQRLEDNNVVLEKQANLLERNIKMGLFRLQSEADQRLYNFCTNLSESLHTELKRSHTPTEIEDILKGYQRILNDSLRHTSALPVELKIEVFQSENFNLQNAWRQNSYLLFRIAALEKNLEVQEMRSKDSFREIQAVVFSKESKEYRAGGNAIFDIAVKTRKAESSEIVPEKLLHNGQELPLKQIEIDQFTQRIIVHKLGPGEYEVYGKLILTNDRGEQTAYPFFKTFRVEKQK